jgi:hypothetical protein
MYQINAKLPNCHKIYQIAVIYIPNEHKMYQHFPFQGPLKFTQIRFFDFKIYHLETLLKSNGFIFTKNGLGYILGYFFTKSSGHPVLKSCIVPMYTSFLKHCRRKNNLCAFSCFQFNMICAKQCMYICTQANLSFKALASRVGIICFRHLFKCDF